jgi:hypothetical protein
MQSQALLKSTVRWIHQFSCGLKGAIFLSFFLCSGVQDVLELTVLFVKENWGCQLVAECKGEMCKLDFLGEAACIVLYIVVF